MDVSSRSTSAGLPSVPRWTPDEDTEGTEELAGGRVETPDVFDAPPPLPAAPVSSGVVSQAVIVSMTEDNATSVFSIGLLPPGIGRRQCRAHFFASALYPRCNGDGTLHSHRPARKSGASTSARTPP